MTKQKDSVSELLTAFAAVIGPAASALAAYFQLLSQMSPLLHRIDAALKAGKSLELSPEDVKVLALILMNLSARK